MWTNFYLRNNICDHCNRFDEEHLWKSSGGWDFTIHHIEERFNSWNEFFEYTKNWKIFDEYWEEIKHEDFIELLKSKQKEYPFAHKKEYDPYWKYIDWFYFVTGTFS